MPPTRPARSLVDSSPVAAHVRRSNRTDPASRQKHVPASSEIIEISSDSDDDVPMYEASKTANLEKQLSRMRREKAKLEIENQKLRKDKACFEEALKVSEAKNKSPMSGSGPVIATDKLEDNLCCEICTVKMWQPYSLSDCGHTFCQTCLVDWFTTARQQYIASHPHYIPNAPVATPAYIREIVHFGQFVPKNLISILKQLDTGGPSYTCPTCREPVTVPPTESFALKSLVRIVAEAEGESSPQKPKARGKNKASASTHKPFALFFS